MRWSSDFDLRAAGISLATSANYGESAVSPWFLQTTDPDTGLINWNDETPAWRGGGGDKYGAIFDYGLYDEASGGFWGANYTPTSMNDKGEPIGFPHLADMPDFYTQYQGRVVYCVLCEGNNPTGSF